MDSQLKRGLLEGCVLAALYTTDNYGYMLLKDMSQIIEISESTLYPILRRLEKSNQLTTYSKEKDGRLRKYYSITDSGKDKILSFKSELSEFAEVYEFIKRRT